MKIFNFQKMKKGLLKVFLLGSLIFSLFVPESTLAAVLYMEPEKGEYGYGDVFAVAIKLDLEGADECINTVEGVIGFDRQYLELVDFSAGDSILSLWINLPKTGDTATINHEKRLEFSGGIPGGYCGKIPGDPGESNIIGKIIFKVISWEKTGARPEVKVNFLPGTLALLNDGFGTAAKLTLKDAAFAVTDRSAGKKQEWQRLIEEDKLPPEPFFVEIQRNPELFEGKYYIIFNTTDKQTGIDRYEVKEEKIVSERDKKSWLKRLLSLFGGKVAAPAWQPGATPYVLSDQELLSNIKVRAIDKAGNERIAEYIPQERPERTGRGLTIVLLALSAILAAVLAALVYRRKSQTKI